MYHVPNVSKSLNVLEWIFVIILFVTILSVTTFDTVNFFKFDINILIKIKSILNEFKDIFLTLIFFPDVYF